MPHQLKYRIYWALEGSCGTTDVSGDLYAVFGYFSAVLAPQGYKMIETQRLT